jgi:hypothetical protein
VLRNTAICRRLFPRLLYNPQSGRRLPLVKSNPVYPPDCWAVRSCDCRAGDKRYWLNIMRIAILILMHLLFMPLQCLADSPRPNSPIVAAAEGGSCYAKSIPAHAWGQKGVTKIYSVGELKDSLIDSYDWFSFQIFISCGAGINTQVVRMGPWANGEVASQDDLAIAFYSNGKLLKQYSTLDIAEQPGNVEASSSHYRVFSSIEGFTRAYGDTYFVVVRIDGKVMKFEPGTGLLVQKKR